MIRSTPNRPLLTHCGFSSLFQKGNHFSFSLWPDWIVGRYRMAVAVERHEATVWQVSRHLAPLFYGLHPISPAMHEQTRSLNLWQDVGGV